MNHIFNLVSNALSIHVGDTGSLKAFAFGSATRISVNSSDIDILIIYYELWQPEKIRQVIAQFDMIDIDVIFMLPEEEAETNFIAAQDCIRIA